MKESTPQDRLDHATAARLAKLADRPVDTSRLEQVMREQTAVRPNALRFPQQAWRPFASVAAALVIAMTIGWFTLDGGTTPAMAAPSGLARIHFDVVNGITPHLKVSSVAEANRRLADQSDGIIPVPPLTDTLKSCCLRPHEGTTLTCVLIEREGQLITLAIADGTQLVSPQGQTFIRNGRRFIAHTAEGINMVMTHEGDRWLCVMGETTIDTLIEVAVDIKL